MAELHWSKALSVGVPSLDSDHRALIRIINALDKIEATGHGDVTVDAVLDTLFAYARYHFAREEHVMQACGFPGEPFHRVEHETFAMYMRDMRERGRGMNEAALATELLDYLTEWLRHHILIQDMAYKPFVTGRLEAERVAGTVGPEIVQLGA